MRHADCRKRAHTIYGCLSIKYNNKTGNHRFPSLCSCARVPKANSFLSPPPDFFLHRTKPNQTTRQPQPQQQPRTLAQRHYAYLVISPWKLYKLSLADSFPPVTRHAVCWHRNSQQRKHVGIYNVPTGAYIRRAIAKYPTHTLPHGEYIHANTHIHTQINRRRCKIANRSTTLSREEAASAQRRGESLDAIGSR